MNEKSSFSLKQVTGIISKHHSFIFIVVTCLALAAVVYSLYDVLTMSDTVGGTTNSSISGFDKATIAKIQNLHDSSDASSSKTNFPCPRQYVFSEQRIRCIDWFSQQLGDYQAANSGNAPSDTTALCTFVKTYLDGTNCTTTSDNYTDDDGKPYVIQYRKAPKASNEIGYWDSSSCSAQSANGVTPSSDPNHYALTNFQAGSAVVCVDNN